MLNFKIFDDIEFDEEDNKEEKLICAVCSKLIEGQYFYDKYTKKIFCSQRCYLDEIGKDYFD